MEGHTFRERCHKEERWRNQEGKGREGKGREGKGREGKGREGKGREGKGREGKGREGRKCKNSARTSSVCAFTRKEEEERKFRGKSKTLQGETWLGTMEKMASSLFFLLGQSMLGVNAAAEGSQRRAAVVLRVRGEMQFKEERQTESAY